jgi:Ala-tRNA(Pro) deacylase
MRLDEFLHEQHVPFSRRSHRPAYTANRIAQMLHVPGKDMAKSVLLRTHDGYLLAVLPATHRIDMAALRQELHDEEVALASENDIERIFPDCERGAMPPFGSLYELPTMVDESLAEDARIVFEGQNHEEAIEMACWDFMEVERPRLGHFACRG